MKILIGVDGSHGSFEAVAFVARLIDPARDQLALYYSPTEVPLKSGGSVDTAMVDRARQALADAIFAEARKRLPDAARAAVKSCIVGTQAPGHGVLVAADQWRADVIAVGARGLGPLQSMFLGSVSRQVVAAATVPVLVVRPDRLPGDQMLRLLLAYDRASAARQAEIVNQFSWPPGTVGHVVRVIESLLAGPLPPWLEQQARSADAEAMAQAWVSEHQSELQTQREELIGYLGKLPKAFAGQMPIVCEGNPADLLIKTIGSEKIDLTIVGKTAGGAIKRMLVGSTSAKILNHAPCSVLVIPLHESP